MKCVRSHGETPFFRPSANSPDTIWIDTYLHLAWRLSPRSLEMFPLGANAMGGRTSLYGRVPQMPCRISLSEWEAHL
jgi:hypothetical protein